MGHRVGQRRIEEDHPVLGVAHDVTQVVLEQADVERVEDRPHRRHSHVQLEMTHRVPTERGDPISWPDAELAQGAGERPRAPHHLAVVGALNAGGGDAHHLPRRKQLPGTLGDRAHQQRRAHHQALERGRRCLCAHARIMPTAANDGELVDASSTETATFAFGAYAPWHFLNFLPDPHQHGSLRPICSLGSTRRCSTWVGTSSGMPAAAASAPAAAAIAIAPWAWRPPE